MRRRFKSAARAGGHAVLGRPQIGVFIRARTAQRAVPTRTKHPHLVPRERVFCSGDVLLSHDLSSYYHRGCSVSLPCSEWERVVPLRWGHQKFVPRWRDKFLAAALSHRVISDR